jgi:predicted adenine nucleotide alpha hydrolase (AANH) superfamily ATPase
MLSHVWMGQLRLRDSKLHPGKWQSQNRESRERGQRCSACISLQLVKQIQENIQALESE